MSSRFEAHKQNGADDGTRNIAVSSDPTSPIPLATSSGKEVRFWRPSSSGVLKRLKLALCILTTKMSVELSWKRAAPDLRDETWDLVSLQWAKEVPDLIILGDASGIVLYV